LGGLPQSRKRETYPEALWQASNDNLAAVGAELADDARFCFVIGPAMMAMDYSRHLRP
jgi:hypothetical protein